MIRLREKISVKCSVCQKEISISPHNNPKTVCKNCRRNKSWKFRSQEEKIKDLKPPDIFFNDPSIKEILVEIEKTENKKIQASLKQIFIIKLVTLVEIRFRDLMRQYSALLPVLKKLFPYDSNIESKINDVQKTDPTDYALIEDHVAANFNWQNLQVINKCFSELLEINFFQAIKDLEKAIEGGESLEENWEKIEDLFELRNQVVHNAKNVELNNDELEWLFKLVILLSDYAWELIDNYINIQHGDWEGRDDFFEWKGISYEHMKEIIDKNKM